jgi:hypothetical protein
VLQRFRTLIASSTVLIDAIPVVLLTCLNASSRAVAGDAAGARFIGAHSTVALCYSEFSVLDFYACRAGIGQRCACHDKQYAKPGN